MGRWARKEWSGAAEDQECDLGRDADPDGSADRSEAAIDVETRGWTLENQTWQISLRNDGLRRSKKRTLVKAGDVVGTNALGAEAMVKDFHLDLAAVGVASEGKLDAKLGGAIEGIGIV